MPSPASDVVAVVVTYNGAGWIEGCLASLASSQHPVTTIVVDNGSTDDTLTRVAAFPDIICLPQQRNLGFGQANNVGMRAALDRQAGRVLLLNQDARLEPETVGRLVQASVTHPEYGILSPFHLDGEGTGLDTRFAKYALRAGAELLSDLYLGRQKEAYGTAFVNAAAWLVTAECLDTVGGFDPLYFMYGEDNDYCSRARWHGFQVGLVPGARILHDRGPDRFSNRGHARLDSLIASHLASMQANLARPEGPFVGRLGSWVLRSLRTGSVLVGSRQPRSLLAWLIALLAILPRLPKILGHRRANRAPGRHWL